MAVDDAEGIAIKNLRFTDKNIIMEHRYILLQNAALIDVTCSLQWCRVDFEGRFLRLPS